ncbi:L-2-hydroxyglutarate oxidase LhgO [Stieleria bergensis]|uniref:L-2-hydroxyglutarate oxidase LhgO n=1 Tax=Stieleria bergensis TaxID=2528025 RepID=A0A517T035_9BACT|nr:L-2-hydroxyglutarate oxidase LhgO [Planctomycetes bacterium SV_7m_r]
MSCNADFIVIGGGIVGLAVARELQRTSPDATVQVVEAESAVAQHQTGRNSGVIHSGIYYKPGSQKALNCRHGKSLMEAFCQEHDVPWDRCGKVVVATSEQELKALDSIAERALANGVEFARINSDDLRRLEPHVAGLAGLHVPETGIVNYAVVAQKLAEQIRDHGGHIHLGQRVVNVQRSGDSLNIICQSGQTYACQHLINCGGLQCDRIARLCGLDPAIQIVPFRGEYYELRDDRRSLVKNLIYPVPDPAFPFLGVHFTRMIDGGVECGPNAVLALAREGYNWKTLRGKDLLETLRYSGFRKLARRHWKPGLGEIHRSFSKSAFVSALRRLIPELKASDLVPGRAGVRAQAVARDGRLIDDFLIESGPNSTHVLNAPSPAATASLAIAETLVAKLNAS